MVTMKDFDTISAIATARGESGISIIRISGNDALKIGCSIFRGKNNRKLDDIKPYTMRYGHIIDVKTDEIIDEVLVSYMKAPRSYTAEDTIEINCHGGNAATNRVLEEVIRNGARLAEPGEFTKRAFLNGRIDLSQAEAVIDIIRAKTELSMKSAVMQAEGKMSREIKGFRKKLIELIAHIEATVDFPEDDIEGITGEEVGRELKILINEIDKILVSAEEGKIIRDGLNVVIIGKPNVGKSSIMNALLEENRAIVTAVPGTTRDVIEEYINIDGIPLKIVDTAGIRETKDIVEKIGVEKTKEKINEADLIIMMLDSSEALSEEDLEIENYIKDKKYIVLLNKSDLSPKIDKENIGELNAEYIIETSAKTGFGIEETKECIKKLFFNGEVQAKDILLTNMRQKEALNRARMSLLSAADVLTNVESIDLASIDLRNAWNYLGEITGDTLQEDIIDKIFSEFCIGK